MRYRKVDQRFWKDEKIRSLSNDEKLIALYCFTAQSNRIGLFSFSPAMAAEDLETLPQTFGKRFENVLRTLNWQYDLRARVLYIPTWWRYNQPENPNVLIGSLKDLDELPETELFLLFSANLTYLSETYHDMFTTTLRERYPNVTPNIRQNSNSNSNSNSNRRSSKNSTLDELIPNDGKFHTVEQFVEFWNLCKPAKCPAVEAVTPDRQKRYAKYLKTFPLITYWEKVVTEMNASLFLQGLKETKDRAAVARGLDWLCQTGKDGVENCQKTFEGKYRDTPPDANGFVEKWEPNDGNFH